MKVLCATCEDLKIGYAVDESQRASAHNHVMGDESKRKSSFDKTYLVLVCVELGDDFSVVKRIASRVHSQWNANKDEYNTVSLVPFSHLSEMPHPSAEHAERIIGKLYRVLSNKGMLVNSIEANRANRLSACLSIVDNGASVRFSTSSNGLRNLLHEVLEVYGARQVLHELSKLLQRRRD